MSKKAKATDPARFEGNGISYRAKIIGIEDVPEARGDKMCQEMIQQLKGNVKASGQHKQRIFVNVTLEGLKIIDAVSMSVLHTHPVHQISFISRDVTDSRAFGYIYGPGENTHKFFGIKTANAAENLVLTLRDLFQTVYELKKQEIDDAKAKVAAGTEGEGDAAKPEAGSGEATEGEESIYQVPKNNAPVNPQEKEEAASNLLDLEDQVEHILKGIENIKNLEFDDLSQDEAPRQPVSPTSQDAPTSPPISPPTSPATNDPWGLSAPAPQAAATTAAPASSSLSDLEQLSNPPPQISNPFGGMQAFPGTPAPSVGITAPGFGMLPAMSQPGMFGMPGQQPAVSLPVTRDPFGNDPFKMAPQPRQQVPMQMMGAPGAGGPFGQQPGFGAPAFPTAAARVSPIPGHPFPGAPGAGMQPGFGMAQPGFTPFGAPAPIPVMPQQQVGAGAMFPEQPDENLLQPLKPAGQENPAAPKAEAKKGLFDDLIDIKKSAGGDSGGKSPKEMFKDLAQAPKKSMNEMKGSSPTPKASVVVFDQDPFADDPFGSLDAVLNSVASTSDPDPFNPHYVPPPSVPAIAPSSSSSSSPAPNCNPSLPPQPPAPPDPSPRPDLTQSAPSSKESSPETRFDMPDEPPPPLPSHLKVDLTAPSPPPRPPPIPSRPMPKPRKTPPSSPATLSSLSSSAFPAQSNVSSPNTSPAPPPPIPSSPRPTSNVTTSSSSSPATDLSSQPSAVRGGAGMTDAWGFSPSPVPSRPSPRAPSSPSPSWDSVSNLSHSSSQKSLDRTAAVVADADDPFGVPLRSKKSFSSADGASSKRSSRSSGKLSVKSDSKASVVAVDPFGLPLTSSTAAVATERTNSCDGGVMVKGKTEAVEEMDNPFSVSAFDDGGSAAGPKWEAFGDHSFNGEAETISTITTNGQKPNASPFGDAFFPPVNGK